MTTKVLLVEDEALFRNLLNYTFHGQFGIEVIGSAETGEDAIDLARKIQPDAVVMDVELAGPMDGIDAAIAIKMERPETGLVVLSSYGGWSHLERLPLFQSKGWGYLLKRSVPDAESVANAIKDSCAGKLVLDPALIMEFGLSKSGIGGLTARQREVLELMARGSNNLAIAEQLSISPKSVETYVNAIYQKLGLVDASNVNSRVKAVLYYLQYTGATRRHEHPMAGIATSKQARAANHSGPNVQTPW